MTAYRGFLITPDAASPSLYGIATEGQGGGIPKVLAGRYTTRSLACVAIDDYVVTQGDKPSVRKTNPEK